MVDKCKHDNGWVLKEEICIMPDESGCECGLIANFECNNLNCKERKRFKFTIDDLKEV